MQLLRDVLRKSLSASLATLSPADRLAAAWPVVAGSALASHAEVVAYRAGTLTLAVNDDAWRQQVQRAAATLRSELANVSGVAMTDILVVPMPPARFHPGAS